MLYYSNMELALKITPQRSTQYAHMTDILALPELLASPAGTALQHIKPIVLAGPHSLYAQAPDTLFLDPAIRAMFAHLGATSELYQYYPQIGDIVGPFLRPIELDFTPALPFEMAEARRYKGKTNEIFTRVLLNTALFAGDYAQQTTERLRILDPLAGGGTTLFLALAYGYDAFGIDIERQDIETTIGYVRQYLEGEHVRYKELAERSRRAGKRYQLEIFLPLQAASKKVIEGKKEAQRNSRYFVLAHGDAADALNHMREIPGGPHMHAIVGDLPYGIQHFGEIAQLLSRALPVWEQMLLPGGTIALAWNATRITRTEMIGLFEQYTQLQIRDDGPYTQFEHAVDRVIKKRDILVGVKVV